MFRLFLANFLIYITVATTTTQSSKRDCPCGIIQAVVSEGGKISKLQRKVCHGQDAFDPLWHMQSTKQYCILTMELVLCNRRSCDGVLKGFRIVQHFNQHMSITVNLLETKNINNFVTSNNELSFRCRLESGECGPLFRGKIKKFTGDNWFDNYGDNMTLSSNTSSLFDSYDEVLQKLADQEAALPPRMRATDVTYVQELTIVMKDTTSASPSTTVESTSDNFLKTTENPKSKNTSGSSFRSIPVLEATTRPSCPSSPSSSDKIHAGVKTEASGSSTPSCSKTSFWGLLSGCIIIYIVLFVLIVVFAILAIRRRMNNDKLDELEKEIEELEKDAEKEKEDQDKTTKEDRRTFDTNIKNMDDTVSQQSQQLFTTKAQLDAAEARTIKID